MLRALGHPSGPHLASKAEKKRERKRSPKWRPFWPFELLVSHLGSHLEDPGGKKSVPKTPKGNFVDILKILIFLVFLKLCGGLGSPVELQMVALRGSGEQLGTH